jgi:uncharacterized protein (DUF342 family)
MPSTQAAPQQLQIEMPADKQAARLQVPAKLPREEVTEAACKAALIEAGVQYTQGVAERVQQAIQQLPPVGEAVDRVLAEGRPPKHGVDAKLHWRVEEPEQADQATSFYDRCAYVMVRAGQGIGRTQPATEGEDGLDVTGAPAPATPGQPLAIQFDDTIAQDEQGQLTAQLDGRLVRQSEKAYITQELAVDDSVDFSTGNLDFTGNILFAESIRDRFQVKATGHIEVRGVIEAATINTGGDLSARGGVAGRRGGELSVGEDLIARYLNRALGEIEGELYVEREIMDSLLSVQGAVRAEGAVVVGGVLSAAGSVELKSVGSEAGTLTELVLGCPTRLQQTLHRTQLLRNQAELHHSQMVQQKRPTARRDGQRRWRDQEHQRRLQQIEHQIEKLDRARQSLLGAFERDRAVALTMLHRLHQGTLLTLPGTQWRLRETLNGPVHITATKNGQLIFRQGSAAARPLSRIAKPTDLTR